MAKFQDSFTVDVIHNGAGFGALVQIDRHGIGKQIWWEDTGWEFTEISEPRLRVVEVVNEQGEVLAMPDDSLTDSIFEVASGRYWTLYCEGEFN